MTPVPTLICCGHTPWPSNDRLHAAHGPASSIYWPWLHANHHAWHISCHVPLVIYTVCLWQVTLLWASNPSSRATNDMRYRALYHMDSAHPLVLNNRALICWVSSIMRTILAFKLSVTTTNGNRCTCTSPIQSGPLLRIENISILLKNYYSAFRSGERGIEPGSLGWGT